MVICNEEYLATSSDGSSKKLGRKRGGRPRLDMTPEQRVEYQRAKWRESKEKQRMKKKEMKLNSLQDYSVEQYITEELARVHRLDMEMKEQAIEEKEIIGGFFNMLTTMNDNSKDQYNANIVPGIEVGIVAKVDENHVAITQQIKSDQAEITSEHNMEPIETQTNETVSDLTVKGNIKTDPYMAEIAAHEKRRERQRLASKKYRDKVTQRQRALAKTLV